MEGPAKKEVSAIMEVDILLPWCLSAFLPGSLLVPAQYLHHTL